MYSAIAVKKQIPSMTILLICFLFCSLTSPASAQQYKLKADLDPYILLPGAYQKTPEDLEKHFDKGDLRVTRISNGSQSKRIAQSLSADLTVTWK